MQRKLLAIKESTFNVQSVKFNAISFQRIAADHPRTRICNLQNRNITERLPPIRNLGALALSTGRSCS
jgi:hypothetical protein